MLTGRLKTLKKKKKNINCKSVHKVQTPAELSSAAVSQHPVSQTSVDDAATSARETRCVAAATFSSCNSFRTSHTARSMHITKRHTKLLSRIWQFYPPCRHECVRTKLTAFHKCLVATLQFGSTELSWILIQNYLWLAWHPLIASLAVKVVSVSQLRYRLWAPSTRKAEI